MSDVTRRDWLGGLAAAGGLIALGLEPAAAQQAPGADAGGGDGPYTLPPLPFDYADLEPHISSQTMRLHHDVHHAGYVKGANAALGALELARRAGGEEIHRVRAITDTLAFNLAGHVLHSVLWTNLSRDGGGDPPAESELGKLIQRDFGSNAAFVAHFSAAAAQVQGSGWAILAYEPFGQRLVVLQAEKHQVNTVAMCVPLLVLDVWEHAYYLQYQNMRTSYIKAFFNVINWANVNERLAAAKKLAV